MSHCIHGFIAPLAPLRAAAACLDAAVVVPLAQGFGFLPVTNRLLGPNGPWPFEYLRRLTTSLADWAAAQSRQFPLAYIETEYFGGAGTQTAVAWQDGQVVFGPDRSESKWVNGVVVEVVFVPLLDKPINRAVRLLGVERGVEIDEFAVLGLGRHRSDDAWLSVPKSAGPDAAGSS